MQDSIQYKIKGYINKVVNFECPGCHIPLSTDLKDAGKEDACPQCGHKFVSPGGKDVGKGGEAPTDPELENEKAFVSKGAKRTLCGRCGQNIAGTPFLHEGDEYCESCHTMLLTPKPVPAIELPEVVANLNPFVCGNCDRSIGRLETLYSFKNTTVCHPCYAILSQSLPPASASTSSSTSITSHRNNDSFEQRAKFSANETAKAIEHRAALFVLALILIGAVPACLTMCSGR